MQDPERARAGRPADIIPPRPDVGLSMSSLQPDHIGGFMFTRSSSAEPKGLEPLKSGSSNSGANPALNVPQRRPNPPNTNSAGKSVIGNDLKIIGQGLKIISQGTLQVDGEIEGDVGGSEVIIG